MNSLRYLRSVLVLLVFLLGCSAHAAAQQTIWPSTATPNDLAVGGGQGLELGVSFKSDASGYITAIRFYKGVNNTGTHVGHLWSGTGTLLASATFSGETASGWQQVNLPNPVAITANTIYVTSYWTTGQWSADWSYFATGGYDNPPLHAVADGNGAPNGVCAYGNGTIFPTSCPESTNYWVDVVFKANQPPTITKQPANQTVTAGQSATFSVTATGTAPLSYQWQKNNVNISGATSASYTTPATTSADSGSTFRVIVSNQIGAVTSAAATLTITQAGAQYSIWPSTATPSDLAVGGGQGLELGVSFKSDVSGYITAIRFYKGVNNTGTHVGHLWSGTGTLLASATFSGETASGWQQVNLPNPVAITANTIYVTSYWTTAQWSADWSYFATSGQDNPPLHAVADGNGAPNGVCAYGDGTIFPTSCPESTNYWVDVVFNSGSGTAAPGIQTSASSINFGNDPVGTNLSQPLTITNNGSSTLNISQITTSGSTAFSVSGFSLPLSIAAGQKTSITANFRPGAVGSASGAISIASNAPTSPTSVALNGSGVTATYTLSLNPTSLNFGNVTTGTTSPSQNVTVTNTGNSNVGISQINVSGAGYSVTGGSAPVTISPSQSLTLATQFSPTTTGTANGTISIVSNASGSPASVSLSATGVTSVQHSVALSWNASSSSVSGYNVYRSTVSGGSYTKINSSLVSGLSFTDSNVQSGTTYYYVTTSVDAAGNESANSNEATAAIP